MKRSNLLLLILSIILLSGLLFTDYLLAFQYAKIDLRDPYKNFELIPVQPFSSLKISGGNGYAIRILQGDKYSVRLMNSRKSFFSMQKIGDGLSITFNVADQNYQQPEASVVGLIITAPGMDSLQLSGTNNEVGPFELDSLHVILNKNTLVRCGGLHLDYLGMVGSGISRFDFKSGNDILVLDIGLTNNAVANLWGVHFKHIRPVLQDSSAIIFYRESMKDLQVVGNKR